jgi:CTD small phosphatase-like protein 2
MYIKDLRVINRDLKDLVLVDNAAYSYAFQLDNGIPILPYYHGSQDY